MSYGILVEGFKCWSWLTNIKLFFWESEANLETLQKLFPYIWVSFEFVLKSLKSQSRIFCATEYCFMVLKTRIWLTTTKPFFREIGANLETFQKLSLYIWVSYEFVLKSVNSLNQNFWATEYWFKTSKC